MTQQDEQQPGREPTGNRLLDEPATAERCREDYERAAQTRRSGRATGGPQ